jgi:hypothetical protein
MGFFWGFPMQFLGFPNAVSGVSQRSFWGFPDRTLIKTDSSVVELSSKLLQMRSRRRGQNKARAALPAVAAIPTSAAIPTAADIPNAAAIPTTIPTTIPAAIPAAAAANATTLQNPRRRQLPVRYRTNDAAHAGPDEGEAFDLDNISGDEEELGNLPAPIAITPAGSNTSPLQTATSTVYTDPLVTGNLKQPKGPTDISHFYWIDPDTKSKICIPCE